MYFLWGEKQEIPKQDIIDGFIWNRNPPALKTYMGVISWDKEKILKNCQNEPTSKTNSSFFLKFQVDSAPMVPKKILLETNVNKRPKGLALSWQEADREETGF
jgi:hypothetical protein